MRWIAAALFLFLFATPAMAAPLDVRAKPGPVTIRGVATGVSAHGFTLRTTSHGTYTVLLATATTIVSKGKTGRLSVHDGDHVGVHGFLSGRSLRAISVRLYPVKPKESSLRGTVVTVRQNVLTISVGGKSVSVRLTSQTQLSTAQGPASIGDLKSGGRVLVRVEQTVPLTAVRVRIYQVKTTLRHVVLHGTVATATRGSIVVVVGSSRTEVGVNGQTVVHRGLASAGVAALARGETVTVHACCAGKPLVAISIHIDKTATTHQISLLRGRVVGIANTVIRIAVGKQSTTIGLQSSTVYDVGSAPTSRAGIHIGDEVSIRATKANGQLRAEKVHVYLSSRRPKSFDGAVVAVGRGTLTIDVRGTRTSLPVGARAAISLGGRGVPLTALRIGDHVRAQGLPGTAGGFILDRIDATRKAPGAARVQTVRGTLLSAQGSIFVIADSSGSHHRVRLAAGVRPTLHGKPAPAQAIFPGVATRARGRPSGGVLLATSLTLTVRTGTVKGRVIGITGSTLSVRLTSGEVRKISLPAGLLAQDGSRRLAARSLRAGAYVTVSGYVATPAPLRAVGVTVQHVSIDAAAVVTGVHGGITVRTSRGETYLLRFSASTVITTGPTNLSLSPSDIPNGVRVHVQGTVDSTGALAVSTLAIHLSSVTVRSPVAIVAGQPWTIENGAATHKLRLEPDTSFTQGTHTLAVTDVVNNDDVTVYGYSIANGVILVRKVEVHRKLAGFDGTVLSVTVDGFILQASDGNHRVITSSTTQFTGTSTQLAAALKVHVTGYVRGDGVILATRVKIGK